MSRIVRKWKQQKGNETCDKKLFKVICVHGLSFQSHGHIQYLFHELNIVVPQSQCGAGVIAKIYLRQTLSPPPNREYDAPAFGRYTT